jgi:hypothetical protein
MDYTKVYEDWDSLPDCRMYIPGESLWGKVLPDGNYGVNNVPLSGAYRWQDIVLTKQLSEEDSEKLIVNRRWKSQVWFRYTVPEGATKEELREVRGKIYEAFLPLGHPGFYFDGVGYILIEREVSDEEIYPVIDKILADLGVLPLHRPAGEEEGEDNF